MFFLDLHFRFPFHSIPIRFISLLLYDTTQALLKYMVSSQQRISSTYSPSPKVLDLLIRCGLMGYLFVLLVSHLPSSRKTDSSSVHSLSVGMRRGFQYRKDDHEWTMNVLKITSKGFQFLLEDRAAQVWQVLMYYIEQGMVSSSSSLIRRIGSECNADLLRFDVLERRSGVYWRWSGCFEIVILLE
jgi:hypothetical protein